MNKILHWEQRIALVRHNLHAASRSGDFTFFKSLQAHGFMAGINYVSALSATLGDEADAVLAGLDDLNASIAYMHQDAFKNVYNSVKSNYVENDNSSADHFADKSSIYVDATMQKQMADHSIYKMTSSAIALIQQQAEPAQDAAAHVWITGNTIVADAMEICLKHIDLLENNRTDFIRLEDSWETVKASVCLSTTSLKAVFSLMAVENSASDCQQPSTSVGSFNLGGSSMFRRLSSAFSGGSNPSSRRSSMSIAPSPTGRRDSSTSEYKSPTYLRNSVSSSVPTCLPRSSNPFSPTRLDTIPPTPMFDEEVNPFDNSVPLPPVPALHVPENRVSQAVMILM
ncbi:hypothetical protein AAFC00_004162 [Neodothiora populina]|uniref:Uncharacterized protein n=1 Tax=Neodothiora populina TaxID=2781224 RepID=A0ABR3PJ41_9PEZI